MTLIKISNLMPSLKRLALVSVSSVCFASLLHAGITIHGSTTAYQETGGNWLTMGANDLDGSGGLGTDGYFFFGDFDNNSDNGEPFAFHVKSTPSYITGLSQGSDFHSVADEFGSYGSIDNPNTLNGVDRRGGFGLGVNGGAGANNEILTFTVTSLGAGDVVRVGILAGLEGNPDGRWDPTSITLSDGVDTETVGNHASNPLPANPGNTNTGWVFFDIDSNGTYSVSATKRFTGQGSGVGGLTFDSVMSAIDITDPTDTDGDGMGDNWEIFYFGDLSRDGTSDFDSDGRNDFQEWGDGTDPTNADVDGDGLNDGQEAALGTDPLDNDTDNDGSPDGDEVQAGTNPNNASSVPTIATGRESYPYIAQAVRDSVLVFNEIHYHPAGNDTSLEFIEIYNQFSRRHLHPWGWLSCHRERSLSPCKCNRAFRCFRTF